MVVQHEVLDHEPIRLNPDGGLASRLRRERDQLGSFHGMNYAARL
jgi:hypothetical protein